MYLYLPLNVPVPTFECTCTYLCMYLYLPLYVPVPTFVCTCTYLWIQLKAFGYLISLTIKNVQRNWWTRCHSRHCLWLNCFGAKNYHLVIYARLETKERNLILFAKWKTFFCKFIITFANNLSFTWSPIFQTTTSVCERERENKIELFKWWFRLILSSDENCFSKRDHHHHRMAIWRFW